MTVITKLWTVSVALAIAIAAGSCNKQPEKALTKEEIEQKAEAQFQKSAQMLKDKASEDLEMRMKIEVKAKADSIIRKKYGRSGLPVQDDDSPEIKSGRHIE